MTRKATDQVTTIGIDIGKNNFHLIGLDGAGNIVLHASGQNRKSVAATRMSGLGGRAEVDFGRLDVCL